MLIYGKLINRIIEIIGNETVFNLEISDPCIIYYNVINSENLNERYL